MVSVLRQGLRYILEVMLRKLGDRLDVVGDGGLEVERVMGAGD